MEALLDKFWKATYMNISSDSQLENASVRMTMAEIRVI